MSQRKLFLFSIIVLLVVGGGGLLLVALLLGDDTDGTGSQGAPTVVVSAEPTTAGTGLSAAAGV